MAAPADPVAELYALPLSGFTAARNALAARLKKAGDASGAAEVKALAKPTLSAWAVNRLAREDADALEELFDAGAKARAAQAKALAGGSADTLRERVAEVRDALLALRARAAEILKAEGHAAGDDTLERVTTTLRTASQAAEAADLVREGRLADDLDPLGLAVLAAGPRPVVSAPRARRAAAAAGTEGGEAATPQGVRARLERLRSESRGLRAAPEPRPSGSKAKAASRAAKARAAREAREEREAAHRRREEERRRRRDEETAERERQRRREAELLRLRAAVKSADVEDARAKRAVQDAEEALQAARLALSLAKDEREETLTAARRARQELERAEAT